MPGTSATSAPSLRLSHFLFAHLLHGFVFPRPSGRLLAPPDLARCTSSSSRKISPAACARLPYLGNKTDMIACAIAQAGLLLTAGNVVPLVFLFSPAASSPRKVTVRNRDASSRERLQMENKKKKKKKKQKNWKWRNIMREFCCLCKLDFPSR